MKLNIYWRIDYLIKEYSEDSKELVKIIIFLDNSQR